MTTPRGKAETIAAGPYEFRARSLLSGASALLLALWLLLFSGLTSISAAAGGAHCSPAERLATGCADTLVVAFSGAGESEEEPEATEGEEEPGGNEEAASAEVEAEEESEEANGSSKARSKDGAAVVLSRLRLSTHAKAALEQHEPSASSIGFSFTLSAAAKVQVTLVKQTSTRGHKRWTTLGDTLVLRAGAGRTTQTLKGHNRLSPGRYRLTAKPADGRARSIYLSA